MASRAERKRAARRRVLPGFPKEAPFQTREEVEAYFAEEKLQCLMCGKRYRKLGVHLLRIHEMEADEYKERFGLPWGRGLVCESTFELISAQMTELAEERREELLALLEEHREEARVAPHRERAPFLQAELRERNAERGPPRDPLTDEDYAEFLRRVAGGRRPKDVCEDADTPAHTTVFSHMRENPQFAEAYENAVASLPFEVLASMESLHRSATFDEDCRKLYFDEGMTMHEVGEELGVSAMAVHRAIKRLGLAARHTREEDDG